VLGIAGELCPRRKGCGGGGRDRRHLGPACRRQPIASRWVAERVGITDVRAGLLPEDKETAVRGFTAEGGHVVLVGDAPAPAPVHVGIALGAADADLTARAADAVAVAMRAQ
jgi:cation transport ATPase